MKENDKKIVIRIMNSIALVGNIFTIILIPVIYFLSNYIEEYSEIINKFESGDVSIVAKMIILVLCCILNIINLFLTKNMKKNENITLPTTSEIEELYKKAKESNLFSKEEFYLLDEAYSKFSKLFEIWRIRTCP